MLKILKKYREKIISVSVCMMVLAILGVVSANHVKETADRKEIEAMLSENDLEGTIEIEVGGEVINPGRYSLKEGSRVGDAIEAAGGFTEDANRKINIAFLLRDGEKIIVADKESEPNSGIAYKVNLNTATKNELMSLEGIGDKMAERIIKYRAENGGFSSPQQIKNVQGIGEKMYEEIKNIIAAE